MSQRHKMTVEVTVRVALDIPTGVTPGSVAIQIEEASRSYLPVLGDNTVVIEDIETTLGAWHLSNEDNTFTGRIG